MVKQLNLNFLENLPIDINNNDLRNIFFKIIEELEFFLDFKSLQQNLNIEFGDSPSNTKKSILDLGVHRQFINNKLSITIFKKFKKFLPIILLREAYLTFLPYYVSDNDSIKIFINQIIELNLQNLEIIEEWKDNIYKKNINSEFLESQYDRLKEFFELSIKQEETNTTIEFFFNFIRNNLSILDKSQEDLYDIIFKNFANKISKSINNDEIIDTLWILIKIFYEVKVYRALVDYKNYFLEFKQKGIIKTNMSLREFIKNLRWIKNFTYIGPSYRVDWKLVGIDILFCLFQFNDNLSKNQVDAFIRNLPFFYQPNSSENNFSIKIFGWFILPNVYRKDLMKFLDKLEYYGFIYDKILIEEEKIENSLNLNYFREIFHQKKILVNKKHRDYEPKYEINFQMKSIEKKPYKSLSLLDFLLLDRLRYYSITGFSFEQRNEALRNLKSDLINEIISQKRIIKSFKKYVKEIRKDELISQNFIYFIENNKRVGFFFLLELLNNLINFIDLIMDLIDKNQLKNLYDIRECLLNKNYHKSLNKDIQIEDNITKTIIFKDLFPSYFNNKKEFFNKKQQYKIFRDYLAFCEKLKIYNLNAIVKIIQNKNLGEKIFITKEKKLDKLYNKNDHLELKKEDLKEKLNHFIFQKPRLIKPQLITTISVGVFAKYYLLIIIKKNEETLQIYNYLKTQFPRVLYLIGNDIFKNSKIFSIQLWLHNISSYEKLLLISIFWNLFKEDLISLRRYFFEGFFKPYSRKDFYDFEKQQFFYTQDLFTEYFKYTNTIFGEKKEKSQNTKNEVESLFWMENKEDINFLIEKIADRISREQIEFKQTKFEKLKDFHQNLVSYISNNKTFNSIKEKQFFKHYINHIYYIPNYQKFGYSYYYLYINPSDLDEVDFKLLFINSFDQVKYPGYIDKSKCLLVSYLFPYRNPNKTYLNWLAKSKKVVNEYCLFYIKKLHQFFHFDYNLSPNGWDLNHNRFQSFYQNILFKEGYNIKPSLIKTYKFGNLDSGEKYSPESQEYKTIESLYSFEKSDLKTILSLKSQSEIQNIENLTKKELIFPYIDLKNLGLIEGLNIILPDIEKENISQIKKIFSFFNFGFIYEIEGSYFINDSKEEKFFENGLLIKLHLPDSNIGEFISHFNYIFQYLGLQKYLILNDLLEGKPLLKNLYGDLSFLENYNPFQNLEWNKKDKIWMNGKLFDEKFNFLYPNLRSRENREPQKNDIS